MASSRISKSSVDWARFAKLIPKCDVSKFNAFKATSDSYIVRVNSYPEKAPEIDFNKYRSEIANKDVVAKLESAYKAAQVPYPKDNLTPEIEDQARLAKKQYELFVQISNDKIKEAEEMKTRFEVMIPYGQMLHEDFKMTFPDWDFSRNYPTQEPNDELQPGISKEERARRHEPDPYPYAIKGFLK